MVCPVFIIRGGRVNIMSWYELFNLVKYIWCYDFHFFLSGLV